MSLLRRRAAGRGNGPAPEPWTPLRRPLADCRLALVASSVCAAPSGGGFDRGVTVGDPTLRDVPGEASAEALGAASRDGADASAANLDRNLAMALERLREAVADGRLGELNGRHLALGGVMAATDRAVRRQAAAAVRRLLADAVDVALLVPT